MSKSPRKPAIVIGDATSSSTGYAMRAKQQGRRVIELRTLPASTDYYTRAYRPELIDEVVDYRLLGSSDTAVLDALHDHGPLVIGADSSVGIVERLQKQRGELRNAANRIEARYDKAAQAEAMAAAGLPIPEQRFCGDLMSALRFAHGRYPVVLKPTASAGTDGVLLAHKPTELRGHFETIASSPSLYGRRNRGALVMDYIDPGQAAEYAVDAVSLDGRRIVTDVWRYEKEPMAATPAMYRSAMTVPLDEARPEIAFAMRMLDAVGHHHGPSHTELWRLDSGGLRHRYGSAHLPVETASRLPGVVPQLSAAAYRRDQVELGYRALVEPETFAAAADAAEAVPESAHRTAAVVFWASPRSGTLRRAVPIEQLRALRSYTGHDLRAQASGDPVAATIDLPSVLGSIRLLHADRSVVTQDIETLRQLEKEVATDVV
ncbi:MAG: ATP-grasp domain-containing protein [Planctomycetota bacterium]